MGLVQDHIQGTGKKISAIIAIRDEILRHEAEKFIGKQVKILPAIDTNPESVRTRKVRGIEFAGNFYGKPLLIVITDNGARLPVFSHNEMIEIEQ